MPKPSITLEYLQEKREIPEKFNHPECMDALRTWLDYKRERKQGYKSTLGVKMIFKVFDRHSPNDLVSAIHQSIASNWQGIFPPKGYNSQNNMQRKATSCQAMLNYAREMDMRDVNE